MMSDTSEPSEGIRENEENEGGDTDSAFLNVPVEIFLHICSFLDARFITQSLTLVCKHFHAILSDDSIWKSRIAKHLNTIYPALPVDNDEFKWGVACALIEDEYNLWHDKEETMTRILLKDIHYASVDAILLMRSGTLCFSGSRDHNLVAWDLKESLKGKTVPKVVIPNAHRGWIWNLASHNDVLYSCSWDATVKSWDINELQETTVFPCKHPALALVCSPGLLAVGLFNRRVMLFDPRAQKSNVSFYSAHTGAVLALTMVDGYIVSASEDKTIAVWDQRARKIFKKQNLFADNTESNAYPMCLSFANNILYVGDVKGQLHLMDPTSGEFDFIESFNVGHTGKMTGIQHNPGSVMTSSTDGTMRILSPTRTLEPITAIKSEGGEITKFDYKNNVLAMGTTDCLVEVWVPKSHSEF